MYRQVKYQVKIEPLPHKNLRKNISAYYLLLKSDKAPNKIFSKPLLIDSEREDDIPSTNDFVFDRIQLWNYNKMKLVEQQKANFTISDSFTFTCRSEEIVYSVTKSQLAKTNKNLDSTKLRQMLSPQNPSRRKQGQYNELLKTAGKGSTDGSIKIESQEQSLSYGKDNQKPSYKIISAKQYRAY